MTKPELISTDGTVHRELVVVHRIDGTLSRGMLEWNTATGQVVPPGPLEDAVRFRSDSQSESSLLHVAETKAIFFVKRHAGAREHEEVKFFSNIEATDLWIRVRFADGEVLEGRTENNARLLFDSGIWLRPFDSTGNNVLVYVPKSSLVGFHIMGVAVQRPHRDATEATSRDLVNHRVA